MVFVEYFFVGEYGDFFCGGGGVDVIECGEFVC